MGKDKKIFTFRKLPVGNLLDGRKERKRKKGFSVLLAAALVFHTLPAGGLAASASERMGSGLCGHHAGHTADCGYSEEDGTLCGYVCRICLIGNLTAALPDEVTPDNADGVRVQLDEILALYQELTGEEQEQIDLSRCYELQKALDNANAPMLAEVSADYQKASWNGSEVSYTGQTENCTVVADSTVAWEAGWYVVNSTVTISEPITVNGEVNLILADSCTLNAEKGIVVTDGNSLTIYAQKEGTGKLNATGAVEEPKQREYNMSAGIGGSGTDLDSGRITIHGGVIHAAGGGKLGFYGAAGIGGGSSRNVNGGSSGTIIIYGGAITADSGEGAITGAGIGGGGGGINKNGGDGSNITVYGGSITAKSHATDAGGAGIGGGAGNLGKGGAGNNIQICGGTVRATGSYRGAGIGGGGGYSAQYVSCAGGTGSVTISGGIVDARGGAANPSGNYAGDPIGNGGNSGDAPATVNEKNAIVFGNGAGTVCGDVTLDGSYTVPAGYTLNIPAGASLSGSGTLSGGGTFKTQNVTADMISGTDGLVYDSTDQTEKIRLAGAVTICGAEFTADTEGWTMSIEPAVVKEVGSYTVTLKKEGSEPVTRTFSVAECPHTGMKFTPAADGRHTGTCPDCKYELTISVEGTNGLVYDGTPKMPGVTVTQDGAGLDKDKYTVVYSDNTNAGTASVTVSGTNWNFKQDFTIVPAALEITASGQTVTYGQNIIQDPERVTVSGLCSGDQLKGITLTASAIDVPGGTIMPSAADIKNSIGGDAAGNYAITYQTGTLTINRAEGTLAVPETSISRTFGDAEFSLNCTTNGDGRISYASSDKDVVSVSADGNVLIKGAGKADITASLAEGTNHTGGAKETVTVTVARAAAPAVEKQTRQYVYTKGSGGPAAEFDVAGKLPANKGGTRYSCSVSSDAAGILSGAAVDENGRLSCQVAAGAAGSTASITVTAEMANYENATVTLEIKLVDKIQVKITAAPKDAVYDGTAHTGYAGEITCDYPVAGYAFAYTGQDGTEYSGTQAPVNAGSYTVEIRVSDESGDYEGSVSLGFIVEKASIRIRADDKAAEKGGQLPELTCTVYGLAEKDSLATAPELKCSADINTAGSYPIIADGAKVPDNGNYNEEITYENGTLAVVDRTVRVTGVSLDKTAMRLDAGSTGQLTASVLPENAANKNMSWSSGNTAVASVDSSGKVSAASAGAAVITVTTEDGGHTASCTVTVQKDAGGSSGNSSGSSGSSSGSSGGFGSPGSNSGSSGMRQPLIKDSSGRQGWNVIRAEVEKAAQLPEGGTVAVDMNGSISVPVSIFAAMKGKDVTVSFDMGGGITWSVNGKDITAEPSGDTDFSVKADAGAIPKELVEEKAGGLAHLEFSLAHEGAFGFAATLSIQIKSSGGGIAAGSGPSDSYTGMYANLFYYSPSSRILEFICAGKIGEDGMAHLPFTHASDYTLIVSTQPMGGAGMPENPAEPQEPAESEGPRQPGENAPAQVKSVKLSKTVYTYSGKAKKPSVAAVDTEGRKIPGRYYTVTYKNNKKVGKATAAVRFKGGYSGTVKKTFTIRPAGTSIRKLSASSGGFTVKWKKKTTQTDGYQIQYSRNAVFKGVSFGSVFVKKASAVKKSVQGLKAGKKYYVRIRTYKTVKTGGKSTKIYSAWSSSAGIRTLPASAGKRKPSIFPVRDQTFLMVEKQGGKKKAA